MPRDAEKRGIRRSSSNDGNFDSYELSYQSCSVDRSGMILSDESKRVLREQNGYCLTCPGIPIKLYNISKSRLNPLWSQKKARTVEGESLNGCCLRCNPSLNPTTKRQMFDRQASETSLSSSLSSRTLTNNQQCATPQRTTLTLTSQSEHVGRMAASAHKTSPTFSSHSRSTVSSALSDHLSNNVSDNSRLPHRSYMDINNNKVLDSRSDERSFNGCDVVVDNDPRASRGIHEGSNSSNNNNRLQAGLSMSNSSHNTNALARQNSFAETTNHSSPYYSSSHRAAADADFYPPGNTPLQQHSTTRGRCGSFDDSTASISERRAYESSTTTASGSPSSSADPLRGRSMHTQQPRSRVAPPRQYSDHLSHQVPRRGSFESNNSADGPPTSVRRLPSERHLVRVPLAADPRPPLPRGCSVRSVNSCYSSDDESALIAPHVTTRSATRVAPPPPAAAPPAMTMENTDSSALTNVQNLLNDMKALADVELITDVIVDSMDSHPSNEEIQIICFRTIAETFATDTVDCTCVFVSNCHKSMLKALLNFPHSLKLQERGLEALSILAAKEKTRLLWIRHGVCTLMERVLMRFFSEETVVTFAIQVLRSLSCEREGSVMMEQMKMSAKVVEVMHCNMASGAIQRDACALLSNLMVDVDKQDVMAVDKSVFSVIVTAMKEHKNDKAVQASACFALKNLTFEESNLRMVGKESSIYELLRNAQTFDCAREDATVVMERVYVSSAEDQSLEEQVCESLRSLVQVRCDQPDIVEDIVDTLKNYTWSERTTETCVDILLTLANRSEAHKRKLSEESYLSSLKLCAGSEDYSGKIREETHRLINLIGNAE